MALLLPDRWVCGLFLSCDAAEAMWWWWRAVALSEELVGPASILFTDRRRVLHRTALPSSVRDQQHSTRGLGSVRLFDSGRSVRILLLLLLLILLYSTNM